MLGKLDRIKEQQRQQRKHYQSLNWTEAVIAKLVAELVGEAGDLWYEAYLRKPQRVEIKYTVVESIAVENHPQIIREAKKKLIKNINLIGRINHYLLLQYLGVSVEPVIDSMQQASKEVQSNKHKKQGGVEAGMMKKNQQMREGQPQEIKIKLLAQPQIQPFSFDRWKGEIKNKEDFKARITFCREIVESVSFLHQNQRAFFPFTLEEIAFLKDTGHLKLAAHKFKPWRDTTQAELQEIQARKNNKLQKAALGGRLIKYVAPEFLFKSTTIRDIRLNDTWKVGLFIMTLLSGEDLSKEVLGLGNIQEDKRKDYKIIPEDKMAKLKKYLNISQLEEISKTLKFIPSERKSLAQLLIDLKAIEADCNQKFDEGTFKDAKQSYLEAEQQNRVRFIEQLKATEELLSNQHRKKLTQYFKNAQNRVLKGLKAFFRGSHSKFSSRCFYEAVFEKKQLLLVFQDKVHKKKIICYSQEAFDLNKCNGIFGGFIKDSKKLSFIYSPQQNEFCKLKNPERAIGVSYIMGPVIGDGDLAISDGALLNFCRFPTSYEATGKVKRLLKAQKFELEEYDVYQCLF